MEVCRKNCFHTKKDSKFPNSVYQQDAVALKESSSINGTKGMTLTLANTHIHAHTHI